MNELQIFNHEEFGEIRTIEIDGQIYFVGVDVAKALQYSDPIGAVRKHVDSRDRKVLSKSFYKEFLKRANASLEIKSDTSLVDLSGKTAEFLSSQNDHLENFPNRGLTIINESGFYSLVLASELPGARKFQHWVTSEVLPSIRRTGAYGNVISDERIYKKLEALEQKMNVLEKKIDALEKKSGETAKKSVQDTIDALIPCFRSSDRNIGIVTQTIINAVKGNAKLLTVYIEYLMKRK